MAQALARITTSRRRSMASNSRSMDSMVLQLLSIRDMVRRHSNLMASPRIRTTVATRAAATEALSLTTEAMSSRTSNILQTASPNTTETAFIKARHLRTGKPMAVATVTRATNHRNTSRLTKGTEVTDTHLHKAVQKSKHSSPTSMRQTSLTASPLPPTAKLHTHKHRMARLQALSKTAA